MLPFASAFILTPHHRFTFMCVFARSCPLQLAHVRVHVRMLCGHMHPWALHPHPGPSVCMKELLWSVTTQGRHYKQTSPWVSFAPPASFGHITMHADELLRLECPRCCACDGRHQYLLFLQVFRRNPPESRNSAGIRRNPQESTGMEGNSGIPADSAGIHKNSL